MSQRRTMILVAAIAIGALASFLVWNYVGNIQDQAYSDAERVTVFLVKQPITRGTPGNVAQASIVKESIPRKFKPANAISSLDEIAGQVARTDLVANQVVVTDMFVAAGDPEAQTSFADNLTEIRNEDMSTYTLQVDDVRGVAGLIVPGDYVNIMVTKYGEFLSGSSATPEEEGGEGVQQLSDFQARYLYQKAQVLAVDYLTVGDVNTADQSAGATGEAVAATTQEVQTGLITFIVPVKVAQIMASFPAENFYLSLVSKDYQPTEQGEIDIDPLPAEDPSRITPYGPEGARAAD